ncbi:MAG: UDP-N-acetylmuramate dehydrogenase [Candidatus Cloacimonetes bacterium]|nr:UDP-N-acetylmuramate dehydrogenase [Candidatus Cloacimonadota bacterium]MCF7814125.1 UDP-N-acetylmuramate dehydrogenase [Candidatus Cloacimonadota bacterium]MCF7868726.1 UDP-N-acetylmuramate dehydrogenase [Candidatus Cloacimonadota bacterium]MCF7884124.1 UDP-N-acetylmuramate dehydrogenase [Candidatus Cloacimonadota bacterium]
MKEFFSPELIKKTASQKSLRDYSYINIGGKPKYLFTPETIEQLQNIIAAANKTSLDILPIGGCSNLLFGNNINKAIISDVNLPQIFDIKDDTVMVSCNITIKKFIEKTKQAGLSSLYFLSGIPAHLGGTVHMNAGAFDRTISEFLVWIEVVDKNGNIKKVNAEEIDFSYRKISISDFIVRICFKLEKKSEKEIEDEIKEVLKIRHERHPYDFPSLGSTFKNPPGEFAGLLICDCGLAGKMIGGAQISSKHSNFILNVDNATFNDYYDLIDLARSEVKNKFDIDLELENKIIDDLEEQK